MYGGPGAAPPLPPGWATAKDPSSGNTYYFNGAETRWELQRAFDALDSDAKGYLNPTDVRRALKPPKSERRTRRGGGRSSASEDSSWAVSAADINDGRLRSG